MSVRRKSVKSCRTRLYCNVRAADTHWMSPTGLWDTSPFSNDSWTPLRLIIISGLGNQLVSPRRNTLSLADATAGTSQDAQPASASEAARHCADLCCFRGISEPQKPHIRRQWALLVVQRAQRAASAPNGSNFSHAVERRGTLWRRTALASGHTTKTVDHGSLSQTKRSLRATCWCGGGRAYQTAIAAPQEHSMWVQGNPSPCMWFPWCPRSW